MTLFFVCCSPDCGNRWREWCDGILALIVVPSELQTELVLWFSWKCIWKSWRILRMTRECFSNILLFLYVICSCSRCLRPPISILCLYFTPLHSRDWPWVFRQDSRQSSGSGIGSLSNDWAKVGFWSVWFWLLSLFYLSNNSLLSLFICLTNDDMNGSSGWSWAFIIWKS